ncbi:MAG: NUDIX domain-containing protein [Candidatus Gracilibacteria bacterium]|nr:NUDIX domain-containing protein [Candidatus Gracilibacteria bacterium]
MNMKFEKSSGGVVYRKKDGKIEILLLKWTNSRNEDEYVLPKGKIEEDEIAKDTALREIGEEAGLYESDLEVIKFITKLNYTFCASYLPGRPFIDKDVYLFLVKYNGSREPTPRIEERFTGYDWINIRDISKLSLKFDLTGIVSRNKTYFI